MKPIYRTFYSILYVLMGLVAFAIISWPMSQRAIEASTLFPIICLSVAFVLGIFGVLWLDKKLVKAGTSIMLGYLGAFAIRLMYDWTKDPTSHNLFPLEIIIIAFYSFPPALLGTCLTSLLLRPPKIGHKDF